MGSDRSVWDSPSVHFVRFHKCDGECGPPRLYIHTPWGALIIALSKDGWTQAWLPWLGYTWWWWPIVWHP